MSSGDPPTYQRIAATLRAEIKAQYQPGDRFPPQRDLIARFGVASETVRRAVEQLESEGLIVARGQRGTFVQDRPSVRRLTTEFYRRVRPSDPNPEITSPFARSAVASGGRASWEHATSRESADQEIAMRLALDVGEPVVVTRYLYRYDDLAIQTAVSWEPARLTTGTPIEFPEDGAAVGVVARFDVIGMNIDSVEEEVTARIPSAAEVEALQLPPGVAVVDMKRTYYVGDMPVETADIVMAGHRTVIHSKFKVI